jgi:hypothetical protein
MVGRRPCRAGWNTPETTCPTFFLRHVQIQTGGVARRSEAHREGGGTAVALTFAEHRAEATTRAEENTMGILMYSISSSQAMG